MSEEWTTLRVLNWTADRFKRAGMESARLEAQVLLSHVLSCDRVALYTMFDKPLQASELATYRALIKRRLEGEPVAYLVGEQEFWSLCFAVDERVLIPRRDTETLIEVVLDEHADRRDAALRIADVATGSGAIAITLASELPGASVIATDISAAALDAARRNVASNHVDERVELREGDLLAPLAGEQFDVLVSNPPYVPSADIAGLAAEVRCEPVRALDGGSDGLDFLRAIIAEAGDYVVAGGLLALEHGFDQHEAVAALMAATNAFEPATLRKDLAGQPRITHARKR